MKTSNTPTFSFSFLFFLIPGLIFLTSCGDPVKILHQEVKKYGHIPYTSPLAYAGPGTLVGGRPKAMSLVASPETCFPREIDGEDTGLFFQDHTTIPKKNFSMHINLQGNAKLFDVLGTGAPALKASAGIKKVQTLIVEMNGVHIEYLDTVRLTEFYRQHLSQTCKDYLNLVGVIVQTIRVEELKISFYSKNGAHLKLDVDNISQFVDIGVDVSWEIENESSLVINTPKYIGYQLGSFRKEHNGISLYRSFEVTHGRFLFRPINVFEDLDTQLREGLEEPLSLSAFPEIAGVESLAAEYR